MSNEKLPRTVDEAAEYAISTMNDDYKRALKETPFHDLTLFHHGLGTFIRNKCGLWNKANTELLQACGGALVHPDSASMVIIRKIWQKLNNYSDKEIEELISFPVLREVLDILENHKSE